MTAGAHCCHSGNGSSGSGAAKTSNRGHSMSLGFKASFASLEPLRHNRLPPPPPLCVYGLLCVEHGRLPRCFRPPCLMACRSSATPSSLLVASTATQASRQLHMMTLTSSRTAGEAVQMGCGQYIKALRCAWRALLELCCARLVTYRTIAGRTCMHAYRSSEQQGWAVTGYMPCQTPTLK